MRAWLICGLLLVACQSPTQRATKIFKPVEKQVVKVREIAHKQSGSIGRLAGGLSDATEAAMRLNTARPDGDTAKLILALRIATSEKDILTATNSDLLLKIEGLEVEVSKAKGNTVEELASGDAAKSKVWFWRWVCAGIVAAVAALFAARTWLKTTMPMLFFWL